MADIIRIQDRFSRPGRKTAPAIERHDATILLFTGIRYERMDGPGFVPKIAVKTTVNGPVNGASQTH